MEPRDVLEDLGLTGTESRAYLALIELGMAKAGAIIKETGLHNSVTHTALAGLCRKGFASMRRQGNVRYYIPTDPRLLVDLIEERKRRVKELVPTLVSKMIPTRRHEVQLYEGFNGFMAAHYEMIDGIKRGTEWLFFAFYSSDPAISKKVHDFYREFEKERNARGIEVRGLAPKAWGQYYRGRKLQNIKLVNVPIIFNVNICADRVIMTPWDDGEISFLIYSQDLGSHFRNYFYSIFNTSK